MALKACATEADLNLRARELLDLILRLAKRQGYCFAKQQAMANMLGVSKSTVEKYIRDYVRLGLIRVERHRETNHYFPVPDSEKVTIPHSEKVTTLESEKITNLDSQPSTVIEDDLGRGIGDPPPVQEKSADERIDFFQACQLVADKRQPDWFIKSCERIASYRGWNRAGDPAMFMDHWWFKFKRYRPEEFAAAVDDLIQEAEPPFDRAGVASWLQKAIERRRKHCTVRPRAGPAEQRAFPRWTAEQRQELQRQGLLKSKDKHGTQEPIRLDRSTRDHSRGRESPESKEAWSRVSRHLTLRQAEVLQVVHARGSTGATVHEVAAALGTTPNAVSGRLSELRVAGKISKTGQRRAGAAVLISIQTSGETS